MKIALAQLNYKVGDLEGNSRKIIEQIRASAAAGAGLVVFSEMALTGSPAGDLLEFDELTGRSEALMREIAAECRGIAAIVGAPSRNRTGRGKPLHNSAWMLAGGEVKQLIHRQVSVNYDVADDSRYFEPGAGDITTGINGLQLAVITGDLTPEGALPVNRRTLPEGVSLIISIAASPFHYNRPLIRRKAIRELALETGLPVIYVNQTGANTSLIYDGGSFVSDAGGNVIRELPLFSEAVEVVEYDGSWGGGRPAPEVVIDEEERDIALIHDALILGIRDYFRKSGFKKAILGLSGGIDSAVVMALATEALGAENVYGIMLPSHFSPSHSVDDAHALAINLGCRADIIPIEEPFHTLEKSLKPHFGDLPFGLTEENMQARIRGVILMAMSNKFGYILLNTSNKSESAVGYGTLYGDMCGGLAVLGDVYKTDVYRLARYINRNGEIIPLHTIVKPPSAELRPDQKDSDSLPDYDILDKLLFRYIEKQNGKQELAEMGFDPGLVARVLKMVNANEWKRYQSAPVLRVSPRAFGSGRRMPLVAAFPG